MCLTLVVRRPFHQISNSNCFEKRERVPNPSGRTSLRSQPVGGGGGGTKGRSFTSLRGKGRGPSGGRLAVPRDFRSGPDNAHGSGVIDGVLRAQVLDDLSDTHQVFQGHV